jgi:hypothetical protein
MRRRFRFAPVLHGSVAPRRRGDLYRVPIFSRDQSVLRSVSDFHLVEIEDLSVPENILVKSSCYACKRVDVAIFSLFYIAKGSLRVVKI